MQSTEEAGAPLESYILIGESGKDIERTTKEIVHLVSSLFD
jgi:hypothetical protein